MTDCNCDTCLLRRTLERTADENKKLRTVVTSYEEKLKQAEALVEEYSIRGEIMIKDIVRPEHIDTSTPFGSPGFNGLFVNHDQDTSALWIVRFLQARGAGWDDFDKDHLNLFYRMKKPTTEAFHFNGLIMDGYLSLTLDRNVTVHDNFIRAISKRIK